MVSWAKFEGKLFSDPKCSGPLLQTLPLKFLSKRLVLLLYGNLCFVHKTTYLWSIRSPGGGELSLSACPGVGNRPPNENKLQIPGGMPEGGMVTGRIEPCIMFQNRASSPP